MNWTLTIFADVFLAIIFLSIGMPIFIFLFLVERKITKLLSINSLEYKSKNLKELICWIVSAISVALSYVIMRFGFNLFFSKDLQVFFIMLAAFIYGFFIPYLVFRYCYLKAVKKEMKNDL